MTEKRVLFIDIEPKPGGSAPVDSRAEKRLWARSDNTFRFNFFTDGAPQPQEETPPSSEGIEAAASRIPFTGQDSAFAFNFQIPPVENMETDTSAGEHQPSTQQETNPPPDASAQLKAKKKKKKSGKKNPSDSMQHEQNPTPAEGSEGGDDTELSAEEQLNRQLDWCIEQLELGLRSQKGTPKQKEEASRALKTLRSSKAPLVKKRQVMRAMTGDYRKKMEEEKSKQHKLMQSEIASAQVKVVSDSPKKSVFHRKAQVKSQTAAAVDTNPASQSQEETSAFVFAPSKEEFRFNFL